MLQKELEFWISNTQRKRMNIVLKFLMILKIIYQNVTAKTDFTSDKNNIKN